MRQLFFPLFFVATIAASETKENSAIATLVNDLAQETNKTAAAIQTAASGNEIVQQLESWSVFFDGWKKKAKTAERQNKVKLLKAATPPPGIEKELQAFSASVQALMEALQLKMPLIKDDPQHGARIKKIVQKLKEI
ncbi:MAG: hypothetical protein U1F16_16020 [Turneriella sp.]